MKILKTEVKEYLEAVPQARERKYKDRAIVNLLMRKYPPLKIAVMEDRFTKETLIQAVQDYASMDRAWRKCLEDNPELRGSDYEEKDRLETETIDSLREA